MTASDSTCGRKLLYGLCTGTAGFVQELPYPPQSFLPCRSIPGEHMIWEGEAEALSFCYGLYTIAA